MDFRLYKINYYYYYYMDIKQVAILQIYNGWPRLSALADIDHGPGKNLVPPRGTKAHMFFLIGLCM